MGYLPKIVLCLPLTNGAALEPFVEDCLRDKVALIAVVGDGCAEIEERIDWIIVGDGSDKSRFIVTTSHPGETVDEVMEFANFWEGEEGYEGVQKVML